MQLRGLRLGIEPTTLDLYVCVCVCMYVCIGGILKIIFGIYTRCQQIDFLK